MIERLARIAKRPFRGHPGFNGFLIGIGFLLLYVVVAPPLFWLIGQLFLLVLEPLGRAVAWWRKLWS
jgi:hypothetical protein